MGIDAFEGAPVSIEAAGDLLSKHYPAVCFVSRHCAENMVPPVDSHLISISDGPHDEAAIDQSRWASARHYYFVDGEYDTWRIETFGPSFHRCFGSYIKPEQASGLRMRIDEVAHTASNLVVNCQAGRSRSATVATWIAEHYGFVLDQRAHEANQTVLRLLREDCALIDALEAIRPAGYGAPPPTRLRLKRLLDRLGL